MKRFLVGLVLVALLVVAGASLYVNQILGTAIERGATYALGVDTRVGFVRLRLLDGEFRLSRLRVDNPSGFGTTASGDPPENVRPTIGDM